MLKLQDGTRKSDKLFTYSNLHQTNQQVGQFTLWNTFGARTNHGQLWTHLIHHGSDSAEATTFPHIIYSMPLRGTHIRMAFFFVPKLPRKSLETILVWTPGTLNDHNFLLRTPIGMRSETNLQLSLRAFQNVSCSTYTHQGRVDS